MTSTVVGRFRRTALACAALAALGLAPGSAHAQTLGVATMQPGTLNHTAGSAIARVLSEKAGINALVQPTAGETVIIAIVGTGEAHLGMANAPEVASALAAQPDLRLIGAVYPLRVALFARQDSPMRTVSDLAGQRVPLGYSAMRVLDGTTRAILMLGGLTEADVQPILVPNIIRGADDFAAGAADAFFFGFGAPKVREVDATVGGIRVLAIPDDADIEAANEISPYGYLSDVAPGPAFIGLDEPMKIYTFDNLLFAHADVPDDVVYEIIETMENNRDDMIAVLPLLGQFSAEGLYKDYDMPYHPGALKYFEDKGIEAKAIM